MVWGVEADGVRCVTAPPPSVTSDRATRSSHLSDQNRYRQISKSKRDALNRFGHGTGLLVQVQLVGRRVIDLRKNWTSEIADRRVATCARRAIHILSTKKITVSTSQPQ
jgi:hypothetical protein